MLVDPTEMAGGFPRPLDPWETDRLATLLKDAEELIRAEFARAGRDFDAELILYAAWLPVMAKRVIRSMASAAILVGANAGVRSASSSTGPHSDSITFAHVNATDWGQVTLSADHRRELGLGIGYPEPSCTTPIRWPEVHSWKK